MLDTYEFNRENALVSQAGFITAVFSFSTMVSFTVWQISLDELDTIPDAAIHVSIEFITMLLLLSMLFAVLVLYRIVDTSKSTEVILVKLKNEMVKRIKISIRLFLLALSVVFVVAIRFGVCFCIS